MSTPSRAHAGCTPLRESVACVLSARATRYALITGANSGIGLTTVNRRLTARSPELTARRRKCRIDPVTSLGERAVAVQGDVANPADLDRLHDRVKTTSCCAARFADARGLARTSRLWPDTGRLRRRASRAPTSRAGSGRSSAATDAVRVARSSPAPRSSLAEAVGRTSTATTRRCPPGARAGRRPEWRTRVKLYPGHRAPPGGRACSGETSKASATSPPASRRSGESAATRKSPRSSHSSRRTRAVS